MAEERALSAGEDRCHPAALTSHLGPADRVDAAFNRVQSSFGDTMSDGMGGEAESQQLTACNDSVLIFGQLPCTLAPRFGVRACHITYKWASAANSPPLTTCVGGN
jgi:hypothetical protein